MLLIENNELVHVDSASDILEHYGVKGMRWGKRKAVSSTSRIIKSIKDNHRKNIEYSYRKKGYSEDEVQKKTQKRLKLEKAAALAAGTALAAYGSYKLGKHIKNEYMPSNLKKGKTLHTVMKGDSIDLNRDFYAARKGDKQAYKDTWGVFKAAEAQKAGLSGANQFNINVNKKLKVASHHRAAKEFNKLMKNDPEFRKNIIKTYAKNAPHIKDADNAKYLKALASGKRNKKAYDAYNIMYPLNRGDTNDKFQKALKKKGYDAIVDMNDTLFRTQPNAKHKPVIVFNGKDKLSISGKEGIRFKDINNIDITGKASNKHDADMLSRANTIMNKAVDEMFFEENLKKMKRKAAKIGGVAGIGAAAVHVKNNVDRKENEYLYKRKL